MSGIEAAIAHGAGEATITTECGRDGWMRRMLANGQSLLPVAGIIIGVAGTLMALGLIIAALLHDGVASLQLVASGSMAFWIAFAASLLVEPVAEYCILRRLLGTGRETLPPLMRKQSLNALLFGYAGDTYFMGWLQRRTGSAGEAVSLGCDLAIASALVNNIATIALMLLVWEPLQSAAGTRFEGWTAAGAVALIAVPLLLTAWRGLRRPAQGLATILVFQMVRTVIATLLVAATWHLALPAVPLLSWLMLLAARMAVSRLPILPNKDLAFAALVPLFMQANERIGPMIAAVALLTLVAQSAVILPGPVIAMTRRLRARPALA